MFLARLLIVALGATLGLVVATLAANDLPLWDAPGPLLRVATYLNVHEARTVEDSPFPELRPRYYARGPSIVFAKTRAAVATLPRWVILDSDPGARTIHAVVSSAVFGFEDDVVITIVPEPGRPVVQVRATARVGRGDLGTNTRHILDLYAALDALGLHGQQEHPPGS